MPKPIFFTVRGTDRLGDDAPTVEDLLGQIETWIGVLRNVEVAVAQGGKPELVWRVTDAHKNSPLTFEVTPYPATHGMNIEHRAKKVVSAAASGVKQLSETGERPLYFTDQTVEHVEKVYARVTNGLAKTVVDFSNYNEPNFEATPDIARRSLQRITATRAATPVAHRELGSIEGFINKVELDRHGRPIVWLRSRLDGYEVKCVSDSAGLSRIGHLELSEVLRGLRVRVHGILHYKDLERIASISAEAVYLFDPDEALPKLTDIIDPDFTGGLESSAYLEALRTDAEA